ncbi:O-antigen ligase family protein [Aeoliella mucimassa]|uniref:O-Antigen ligase n=1 Tax=Aeoliella mucimassa TaxID=2527972 RepID=A0A518AMX9_9BACT|nr:O-antigen ligase family protein [Aeoliella mucimassa]QDU56080.1 O-Antigen ligase [Aeoliella mucimassa]
MVGSVQRVDTLIVSRSVSEWPYGLALLLAITVVGIYHNQDAVGLDIYDFDVTTQYLEEQADSDNQVQVGTQQKKICFLMLVAIAGYLSFVRQPAKAYHPNRLVWVAAACLLWAGGSILWSTEPQLTVRELVRLYVMVLTAFGLARCFSANQLMFVVLAICSCSIFTALATEAAAGVLKPWQGDYRLQGGMHANMVAIHAAIMALAAMGMMRVVKHKSWCWVLLLVALASLWLTKSRSAAGVFLVAAAIQWSLHLDTKRAIGYWAWMSTIVALMLFVLAAGGSQLQRAFGGAAAMGRSEGLGSLTGRIPLWQSVSDDIAKRPITGYGYKAFWTGERRMDIFDEIDWSPTDAHSIYFNSMLEQGFVGLLLNLALVVAALVILVRARHETGVAGYALFATLIAFALMHGLTETGCSEARIGGLCIGMGVFLASGYHKPHITGARASKVSG